MNDLNNDDLDKPLADLHRQFIAGLEQRLSAMQAHYSHLARNGWSAEEAQSLARLAHGLVGAAGSFGLHTLSDAARALERLVQELIHRDPEPGDADIRSIGLALERVAEVIVSAKEPEVSARPRHAPVRREADVPLVYVVDDDAAQAESLARTLRDGGYRTRVFLELPAFHKDWEDSDAERPAAVLLDMVFPEGEHAGAQALTRLDLRREDNIPVVVVSVRDDLPTRLAALRAGACRYLTKPVDEARLTSLLDALTHRQPPEPYRVLLVDDEPLLLEAQATVLRAAGMEVTTLDQPMRVLEVLDSTRPDVVVLDVYMPEISGPELAAVLRERDEQLNLPILFLSAETDMSQQLLALNLGGDDFLVKPVPPDHLVAAVTARARRARQANAMRCRLQNALYEREREHQAINTHAIVSIADRRGDILYVNDRFCAVSGYRREELIGQNHRIVKSGEHAPEFYHGLWGTIASGRIWQGVLCNRRKDGSLYWVESTIVPFMDEQGIPYQYVSIRTDITHVKLAELSLRRQRDMQQLIIHQAARFLSLSLHETDTAIEDVLRVSGEFIGADRAYLFLVSDDGARMSNTHEWCAPGIAPQKQQVQDMPVHETPWWWQQISTQGQVIIPDVDQLPAEAAMEKVHFQTQDIQSLFAFPLLRHDRTIGFLGYDAVRQRRDWHEEELSLLKLLADVISSALTRMRAEQALIESEQGLIATLESTQDGILAVDENRRVCFVNQRFQEIWGIPDQDLFQGQDDHHLLSHARSRVADPEVFLAGVEALYASGQASHDILHFTDGRVIERYCKPLFWNGKPGGMVWSFHDITAIKQAEAAAELHKERLRRGQAYANIGTWEWNIVTGELFWTERIAPLFGYPEGDLETSYENFLNAVHPDDRQSVIDAVNACVERDEPYEIEHRVIWPDGTVRWLLEKGAVTRDAEGRPLQMLGVVQDIDERKQAELALIAAREEADRANRAKSEFLSSMSHELRTPMNAILGFAQLMEYDDALPAEHVDNLHEILKAGRHLLELINEVLDLARIESGNLDLSIEPVALCPVIEECISLIEPLAAKRDVRVNHGGMEGVWVRADRTRLKQALLNLLSNAVKYNRQGGRVSLDIQPVRDGAWLRILVSDTGQGLTRSQVARLFEPFNRLGAERSGVEGTGIGLTITRRLVEMMGGNVGVQSEPGEGSTFWIELPLESISDDRPIPAQERDLASDATAAPAESDQHLVLYIEDNPSNIKLVAQILGRLPHISLLTAHTPSLGIELAMARRPRLILMDINMPELDGYQVMRVLQGDIYLRDIPVIAVTANAMPRDIEHGRAAGFAEYLTKPLQVERLLETVQRHLKDTSAIDTPAPAGESS
ncbi:response regulator [Thioalkalivibrio sulfidiphilus]|uniref:response regulator n=1 Tax=Thioalkalivibrio sulfidiphilus TaxID=1033854 RepID=UPI00037236DD|nr:response regulator [Thioalkalivibrio sulfidiphilus]